MSNTPSSADTISGVVRLAKRATIFSMVVGMSQLFVDGSTRSHGKMAQSHYDSFVSVGTSPGALETSEMNMIHLTLGISSASRSKHVEAIPR